MKISQLQDYENYGNNPVYLEQIEHVTQRWNSKEINEAHFHCQMAVCYSSLFKSEECKMHAAQMPDWAHAQEQSEAFVAVARILVYEKKIDEALENYEKAIKLEPEHSTALEEAAWCCFELKKWQQAEDLFRKGCELHSYFYPFWDGLGRSLAQQEKFEEAIIVFQNAKEACKENKGEYIFDHLIGQCYAGMNDFYRALEYYTKCLQVKPTYGLALNDMAAVYYNLDGDMTTAIKYLKEAEAVAEKEGNAHTLQLVYINLSRTYDKLKEFDLHEHYKMKLLETLGFGGLFDDDEDDDQREDDDVDENEQNKSE